MKMNDGKETDAYNSTMADINHITENEDEAESSSDVEDKSLKLINSGISLNVGLGKVWSLEESKYLVVLYRKYIGLVRSFGGQFRRKKEMWDRIALDINKAFDLKRTGVHCENRFKTLIRQRKRKGEYIDRKRKKDGSLVNASHIENIAEDSQHQDYDSNEEPMNNNFTQSNNADKPSIITQNKSVSGSMVIRDTLLEIFQIQEENLERQHQEMLSLWREFIKK